MEEKEMGGEEGKKKRGRGENGRREMDGRRQEVGMAEWEKGRNKLTGRLKYKACISK